MIKQRHVTFESQSSNSLATYDLQRLFKGCNLRLARGSSLLEGLSLVEALWHQLVIVAVCCQELVLSSLEILGVFLHLRLCCSFVRSVHFNFSRLHGFVLLAFGHELIVCLLSR